MRRLYDEIELLVLHGGAQTLADVCAALERSAEYSLPLAAPFIKTKNNAVQVMTAHKSKGLEFSVVIVPHLYDRLWGGFTKRSYFDIPLTRHLDEHSFDPLDDERRLLYVAMTRAKRRLHLSSSEVTVDEKECLPSRLLEQLAPAYILEIDTTKEEETFTAIDTLVPKNGEVPIDSICTPDITRGNVVFPRRPLIIIFGVLGIICIEMYSASQKYNRCICYTGQQCTM